MTKEENIKAILECNFAGFKEEIINIAAKRICELEQEPMIEIDLYSVINQKYIEREVLDKIRAEIDAIYKEDMECDGCSDMGMVLEIIDKYKLESEERHDN